MLGIKKQIIFNEQQIPVAVQIPFEQYQLIEEILEDYGLAQLMDEVEQDETLTFHEAKAYYQNLKKKLASRIHKKVFKRIIQTTIDNSKTI